MKRFFLLLILCLSLAGCGTRPGPVPSPMGDDLGNGGDPLSKRFELGRGVAVKMLQLIDAFTDEDLTAFPAAQRLRLNHWYQSHRAALRSDVEGTGAYRWRRRNPNGACGETASHAVAPIFLSYDLCQKVRTVRDAAAHLIGESVHHFGIKDDSFTAQIAVAMSKAWLRILGRQPAFLGTRRRFEEGRAYLANVLSRLEEKAIFDQVGAQLSREEARWIWENRTRLAEGLRAQDAAWVDELPSSDCPESACLEENTEDPGVTLAYGACGALAENKAQAGAIWLHGLLHRWRGKDESRVAALTRTVQLAWASQGHPEEAHWESIDDGGVYRLRTGLDGQVWTGTELAVWNGVTGSDGTVRPIDFYNPQTKQWRQVQPHNAFVDKRDAGVGGPVPEYRSVWAGGKIVTLRQCSPGTASSVGRTFNLESARWEEMSPVGAPSPREQAVVLSVGGKVLVWGGLVCGSYRALGDGAVYDVASNRWIPLPNDGALSARSGVAAVVAGNKVFLWGGVKGIYPEDEVFGDGAVFDIRPEAWRWSPLDPKLPSFPDKRFHSVAVWIKPWVVVYGGTDSSRNAQYSGFRYNLDENYWLPMSPTPGNHPNHWWDRHAIGTGTHLLLFESGLHFYDPFKDEWTSTRQPFFPVDEGLQSVLWTGMEAIFWRLGEHFPLPNVALFF